MSHASKLTRQAQAVKSALDIARSRADTEGMSDPIDWPGIRANAVSLGIRGAARAAGRDLTPEEQARFVERVMKRASREGWEAARLSVLSAAVSADRMRVGPPPKELSAKVRNGADSAAFTLAERKEESGLYQSKYLVRASAALAEVPAERLLVVTTEASALAAMRSKLYPDPEQGTQVGVVISLGRSEVG